MEPDTERGLYRKYHVERLNDHEGKHAKCQFFVLDLNHDPFARAALLAYAGACADEYPVLSDDLRAMVE